MTGPSKCAILEVDREGSGGNNMATAEQTLVTRQTIGLGTIEYESRVETGEVKEGDVVGKLIILKFGNDLVLPYETLKNIYLGAGLSENAMPHRRAGSDAWRVATAELKDREIKTRRAGTLRLLLRDWERSSTPRRDIALERQDRVNGWFEYKSPAVKIVYDAREDDLKWDNMLDPRNFREAEAYHILEEMMDQTRKEFQRVHGIIDGEAVSRSINKVLDQTAPVPMGHGTKLIWNEHQGVLDCISSVLDALNRYNGVTADQALEEDEEQEGYNPKKSTMRVFTVVNTPLERKTISQAVDEIIAHDVDQAMERMAKLMRYPEKVSKYQADYEVANHRRLLEMFEEFTLRFRKDKKHIEKRLEALWKQQEEMRKVVRINRDLKLDEQKAGKLERVASSAAS